MNSDDTNMVCVEKKIIAACARVASFFGSTVDELDV